MCPRHRNTKFVLVDLQILQQKCLFVTSWILTQNLIGKAQKNNAIFMVVHWHLFTQILKINCCTFQRKIRIFWSGGLVTANIMVIN